MKKIRNPLDIGPCMLHTNYFRCYKMEVIYIILVQSIYFICPQFIVIWSIIIKMDIIFKSVLNHVIHLQLKATDYFKDLDLITSS